MADALARLQTPKSPVLEKYRSRLMLTYRTNIDGTPVPQRLPFRVLVLGQLTSAKYRDIGICPALSDRAIRSISPSKPASSPDEHLAALVPWLPLGIFGAQPGRSTGPFEVKIEGVYKVPTIDVRLNGEAPKDAAQFPFSGFGSFESVEDGPHMPKLKAGGIRMNGKLSVKAGANGVAEVADDVTLSIGGVISASIVDSSTSQVVRKVVVYLDPADGVKIKKEDLKLDDKNSDENVTRFTVANADAGLAVSARLALPLLGMSSFAPDEIVANVPELMRLSVIRDLVLDLQSTIRNSPAVRDELHDLIPAKPKVLANFQTWAKKQFEFLQINVPPPAPPAPVDPNAPAPAPAPAPDADAKVKALKDGLGENDAAADESIAEMNQLLAPLSDAFSTLLTTIVKYEAPLSLVSKSKTRGYVFHNRDADVTDAHRFLNSLAALLVNIDEIKADGSSSTLSSFFDLYRQIAKVVDASNGALRDGLDSIYHNADFRELESNWRGISELADAVTAEDVIIDFLDVSKEELTRDLEDNHLDIFGSALFHKLYIDEYDRFGGNPFATMLGLYEFTADTGDIAWLSTMKDVCAAAHCPFIASTAPKFFGRSTYGEVAAIADLDAIMNHPRMSKWNALRDTDFAAYIGLTLPRYIQRRPWAKADEDADNQVGYDESVSQLMADGKTLELVRENFCWGNAAVLFGKNIVRSYERSGWAQNIRGPMGGGTVDGLVGYSFRRDDGSELFVNPVEIAVPDFREYQFARNGLIALVQKKDEATATFFSAQSIKRPKDFVEDLATKNAYLVTNLAYTFSITMIAHYVKAMMRQYIGSTANGEYIQNTLSAWLSRFVTTVVNPDDLTLLYYPFKATDVVVEPKPGPFGWYRAVISVLPHAQFEGMDVELRLEAGLGGKA